MMVCAVVYLWCACLLYFKWRSRIVGDISVAKMIMRSLCCLASCHCFKVEGPGGLLEILDVLLNISYGGWASSTQLYVHAQIATYLVAVSIPYVVNMLMKLGDPNEFLSRAVAQCARVVNDYISIYQRGQACAVFHNNSLENDDTSTTQKNLAASPASNSIQCWDTLWESCKLALDVVQAARSNGTNGSSSTSSSHSSFVAPACIPHPWRQIPALLDYTDGKGDAP
jgi:hypothetical protein